MATLCEPENFEEDDVHVNPTAVEVDILELQDNKMPLLETENSKAPLLPKENKSTNNGAEGSSDDSGTHLLQTENSPTKDVEVKKENVKSNNGIKNKSKQNHRENGDEIIVLEEGHPNNGWTNHDIAGGSIPPPSYTALFTHTDRPEEQFQRYYREWIGQFDLSNSRTDLQMDHPELSEEEAREALLKHVSQKCCYGSSAARDMHIKEITHTSALHYTLESFTESRELTWCEKPYKDEPLDSPQHGQIPSPWSIPCEPTELFKRETIDIVVPHTEMIRVCHPCDGTGWRDCGNCHSQGSKQCLICMGTGGRRVGYGRYSVPCNNCHASGKIKCPSCAGVGKNMCIVCDGMKKMKRFLVMTVAYKNNRSHHIVEHTDLPDELIKDVDGKLIFQQILPRVWPITNYTNQEICEKSKEYCDFHDEHFRGEKIHHQRQELHVKPVWECSIIFRGKPWRFWVYGNEHVVYETEYPQRYCWCCAIM